MGITGGNRSDLQVRKERKNEFGLKRQAEFLQAFANSCNISAAAAQCKVALSTIWCRRQKDPQFRAAFDVAQDNAVTNLKLELIRRGLELTRAGSPDEVAASALGGMDAKFLMSLVVQHERALGTEVGDQRPKRSDASEASKRLYALLLRMRMERERKAERDAARRGE